MENDVLVGWLCPVCEKIISPYEQQCPICLSNIEDKEEKEYMYWPFNPPKEYFNKENYNYNGK